MKIEKIIKTSGLYTKLQEFIEKHRLLFNSAAWVHNYPSQQISQCAIVNNNNDVIGCFTYFEFKKSTFKFIITAPFSPDISLYYLNPSESKVGRNTFDKEVCHLLAEYFDGLGVHYVDLNLPGDIVDTQPFIWKQYSSRNRYSYLLDLSLSREQLWDNLASEKRKSVNKAIKDGLMIKEVFEPELLHSLVMRSLERNDVAKNKVILKNILFEFANSKNSFAFVAYLNEIALGATFCVYTPAKAIYLFGGFDSENKHHGAGVSCMWQSILKAKELGLQHFDFEGSMNPAIERYFREFGGELTPYFSVQKIKPFLSTLLKLKKHNPL